MLKRGLGLIVAGLLLFPVYAFAEDGKCITCHEGIEKISEVDGMNHLTCTDCHMGDAAAADAEKAHAGMYANPSDLRVIDQTCGTCHPDEVEILIKSLHGTSAGKISGTRYAFGLQDRQSVYGNYAVKDDNPEGKNALAELKEIPSYDPSKPEGPENSPGDDYLRNQCLRCHIWSDGHQRDGDYRASGCAACHVIYSDAGLYEGGDKAIDKAQKDRPMFHRITNKIPEYQCIHCHNRGGRTGVSFIGTMESDGYGTPWTESGGKQGKLHGKHYNHLTANVHYDAGMTCIDCHTKQDIHGDGNIYGKKNHAVEIECEDCHGSMEAYSNLKTSWGNPLPNVEKKGKGFVLTAKLTGKEHTVPQIKDVEFSSEGHTAMVAISQHMETMECYACHAKWAPQCYGCHAKQDISKPNGDWLNGKEGGDPSMSSHKGNREKTAYAWSESRSYLRWETPVLGWNSEGKISTYMPGCQVVFTQVDGEKGLVNNKVFRTVDDTSGFATNPVHPHTTSKEARSCADCHMSDKAIGLGTGTYITKKNGVDLDFEPEQIVDEEGKQLQATSHVGARPFNKAEQQKIRRVGTCEACHGSDAEFWAKVQKKNGLEAAPNDKVHSQGIQKILERSTK
jgi:hypothetical protein